MSIRCDNERGNERISKLNVNRITYVISRIKYRPARYSIKEWKT